MKPAVWLAPAAAAALVVIVALYVHERGRGVGSGAAPVEVAGSSQSSTPLKAPAALPVGEHSERELATAPSVAVVVEDTDSAAVKSANDRPAPQPTLQTLPDFIRSQFEYEAMDLDALRKEREFLGGVLGSLAQVEHEVRLKNGLADYQGPMDLLQKFTVPEQYLNQMFSVTANEQGTYVTVLPPAEYPELYQLQDVCTQLSKLIESRTQLE
jgi:hypothetical protein